MVVECATVWEYNATTAFQLSGEAQVLLHIMCDAPTPALTIETVYVELHRNGEELGSDAWNAPGALCPTSGTPWRAQLELDTQDAGFNETDKLQLLVWFTGPNTEESLQKRAHVRVGNGTYNSTITAQGLPPGIPQPEPGDLSQDTNSPTPSTSATTSTATASPSGTSGSTPATTTSGATNATSTTPTNRSDRTDDPSTAGRTCPSQPGPNRSEPTHDCGLHGGSTDDRDEAGGLYDEDAGQTKEISGEADTPGPSVFAVAAVVSGCAWLLRRRHEV